MSGFTAFAIIGGEQVQNIRAELNEYGDDPTARIRLKVKSDNPAVLALLRHCDFALQACTNTDGGGDENNSHVCPGSPGC